MSYPEVGADCQCGLPSVLRMSGPNARNPNRAFYTCPKNQDQNDRCDYFLWADGQGKPVRKYAKRPSSPVHQVRS